MRALLTALALLLAAPAAIAQEATPLRALITADDTKGWEAVGRIDIGRNGFCTGALIAPHLVLTAAHCLYDPTTGKPVAAAQIEFLAGWRNGRASAYRNVRRALPHPDFVYTGREGVSGVAFDVALLELDQPIRNSSITPFATDIRPRKGDEVGVVSYARERDTRPALQEVCHVLARPAGALVLSCDVDFGSSGAPVFVIQDGVARIVSVVSAKGEVGGRLVSLGTSLERPLAELQAMLSQSDGVFSRPAPVVRRLTLEETRGQGGAKFLRP